MSESRELTITEKKYLAYLIKKMQPKRVAPYSINTFAMDFGQEFKCQSPVGEISIPKEQFNKLRYKHREHLIGLIMPTFVNPTLIVRENKSYLFIRAYWNPAPRDNESEILFTCVSKKDEPYFDMKSGHHKRPNNLLNHIQNGIIIYPKDFDIDAEISDEEVSESNVTGAFPTFKTTAFNASDKASPNYATLSVGFPYTCKDKTKNPYRKENQQKNLGDVDIDAIYQAVKDNPDANVIVMRDNKPKVDLMLKEAKLLEKAESEYMEFFVNNRNVYCEICEKQNEVVLFPKDNYKQKTFKELEKAALQYCKKAHSDSDRYEDMATESFDMDDLPAFRKWIEEHGFTKALNGLGAFVPPIYDARTGRNQYSDLFDSKILQTEAMLLLSAPQNIVEVGDWIELENTPLFAATKRYVEVIKVFSDGGIQTSEVTSNEYHDISFNYDDYKDRKYIIKKAPKMNPYYRIGDKRMIDGVEYTCKGYNFNVIENDFAYWFKVGDEYGAKMIKGKDIEQETPKPPAPLEVPKLSKDKADALNKEIEAMLNSKADFTEEEKAMMRRYVGNGGVASEAKDGVLDEFYTPNWVCTYIYQLAKKHGYTSGNILEPSVGIGNLIKPFLETGDYKNIDAMEKSPVSSKILKTLYPSVNVYNQCFECAFLEQPMNSRVAKKTWLPHAPYDLVIGNPPFKQFRGMYQPLFKGKDRFDRLEWFIICKSLELLKSGGLMIMVVGKGLMSTGVSYQKYKERISEQADLIDAYRLPENCFDYTSVETDILIFKKK